MAQATTSGVTRGLSHGGKFCWRGPTGHRLGMQWL